MLALRRYLGALAVAVAAYAAYALLAAPWLEPRISRAATTGTYTPEMQVDESYRDLFPEDAWERNNPKIVETAQCTLLLKDYQPLPDGRMEINPCTLIFYAAGADTVDGKQLPFQRRRPIVLRAPEGAVLQFDRPIDVGRASVGRLMEGMLRGKIHIFSPPSAPGANDALDLTTRNVKIDREKVYTPSAVDFRYGKSFGRGHDLTITLAPEDKEQPSSAASLGALSVLQLARVERLHLEGNAEGLLPPAGKTSAADTPAKDLPLEVRCEGPLVVDFEQNLAALDEHVEISRVYPQGPPDRLTCDRLIFHLIARGGERGRKKTAAQATAPPFSELVERAVAIGSPVVLDAPQAATFAKAARVEYLAVSKRIALQSGPTAPQVTLRYHHSEFDAREIEYEMAAEGRLGQLWSAGPGRLRFVPAPGQKGEPMEATWEHELRIVPDGKFKVASLKGQPVVKIDRGGSFATSDRMIAAGRVPGEIHLWLLESPEPAGERASSTSPATIRQPSASKGTAARYVIVPDRMLATGNVEIDSAELAVHAKELQAWFEHRPAIEPAPPAGAKFEPAPQQPAAKTDPKQRQLQKLDATAGLVKLRVLRQGNESQVEDLEITGGVKIVELSADGGVAQSPLELVGERVNLWKWSTPHAKLEVQGRDATAAGPAENARVSARGLSLSGARIHLRRADNRLWIPGPGEAELPIPDQSPLIPPPAGAGRLNPSPKNVEQRPASPLKVTWQEAFEFNGEKAVFSGSVEARGEQEFAAGAELTVTLDRRIDFSAGRQSGQAEIARLHFAGGQGNVTLQRVLKDERGQMVAHENAQVRSLDVDRISGAIHADGPGEVWTVRRDQGNLAGGIAPAARPGAEAAARLSYVCVNFRGEITGDLHRREITFHREVDTVYAPVSRFSDRVLATRVEDLGDSGVHLLSETLKVVEMAHSPDNPWIELEAAGNARAEGMKFFAQADRISYTSDKDQLVITSDGRSPAQLWYRAAPGVRESYVTARRFIYQRGNGSLQMDDLRQIDIGSLPQGGKPAPKLR